MIRTRIMNFCFEERERDIEPILHLPYLPPSATLMPWIARGF